MSDLTPSQPAEMFTIRVHDYKDDPAHDNVSLHGLFTDRAEAERIARAVSVAWDFISADVLPIGATAFPEIAAAQNISHIAPDLSSEFIVVGDVVDAEQTDAAPAEPCTHPNCETHGKSPCEGIGCDGMTDAERTEASIRQEFLDLSAEIGAAGERRCTYVYPGATSGGEPLVCGMESYVHGSHCDHEYQDDLTARFAAHVAREEAFRAQQDSEQAGAEPQRDSVADAIALAEVVHEADWMMAGPRWPWHQATAVQREDALLIAQNVLVDPTLDADTLQEIVVRLWSSQPRHGAPSRAAAKVRKIREWLIAEGLCEPIDRP